MWNNAHWAASIQNLLTTMTHCPPVYHDTVVQTHGRRTFSQYFQASDGALLSIYRPDEDLDLQLESRRETAKTIN